MNSLYSNFSTQFKSETLRTFRLFWKFVQVGAYTLLGSIFLITYDVILLLLFCGDSFSFKNFDNNNDVDYILAVATIKINFN